MFEISSISLDAVSAFGLKTFAFLVGLAALIFVHELGHFLAARKCGVIVEKFSIGFGKKTIRDNLPRHRIYYFSYSSRRLRQNER